MYYGFVPRPKQIHLQRLLTRYGIHLQETKNNGPLDQLIKEGAEILDCIFHDIAGKLGNKTIVIPLSGGMDSRAILAGMLKHMPKSQIQTVTVGIPGALDYEIGQQVAKRAGVSNKLINLDKISWREQDLLTYARNFQYPIALMEGYLYSQIFCYFNDDSFFLSGFEGDPLSGSKAKKEENETWEKAITYYAKHANYTESIIFQPYIDLLPHEPMADRNIITFDEQIYFCIRRRFFQKPLVLLKGKNHINAFLDPQWIEFMLNLPKRYRQDQMLYKKILLHAYPEFFSMPLKNCSGLTLTAPAWMVLYKKIATKIMDIGRKFYPFIFSGPLPSLNYINFEQSYRRKEDLKALAQTSLFDLHSRGLIKDVDIPKVWQEHQSGMSNNTPLISLLISLEYFIKTRT